MEIRNGRYDHKIVEDYNNLGTIVDAFRLMGLRVVATIGSWDLLHIGHVRYLNAAKSQGDILVVGTDSDRAIKSYKNPLRPFIPYNERVEMLSYQSCVDLVTSVDDVDESGKWQYGLLEKIRPDIFVAVEDSYPQAQLDDIRRFANKVVVLPRQAENTSTTAIVEGAVKKKIIAMLESMSGVG